MSQPESEKAENLRELLRQHWLHCRHIESERAWFMSVYAAITGGMLAYIFTGDAKEWWPLSFLIFLTLVGFSLTLRWKQAFEHHQNQVEKTAKKLRITANVKIPVKCKILRTRYLFPSFYAVIFVGLIILVITKIIQG